MLSLDETARILGLSSLKHPKRAVVKLCKTGNLVYRKMGKVVTVDPDSISRFVGKDITGLIHETQEIQQSSKA